MRGRRARCIEATRSLKFTGSREMTIALEPECADVDCNANRPAGAVERTCVVKAVGNVRIPVCVQTDCDGGMCEESEAGAADTGAPPVCEPTIRHGTGSLLGAWSFDDPMTIRPSVGNFPAPAVPDTCMVVHAGGMPDCASHLECDNSTLATVLANGVPDAGPFAIGFYFKTQSAGDIVIAQLGAPGAWIGQAIVTVDGTLAWRTFHDFSLKPPTVVPTKLKVADGAWHRVELHVRPGKGIVAWVDGTMEEVVNADLVDTMSTQFGIIADASAIDQVELMALP